MKFKNKKEREQFLDNYTVWELWKEIPEIEVKLYRFAFIKTGAVIIATEHPKIRLLSYGANGARYTKARDVKYHLILREGDNSFKREGWIHEFKLYNPSGDSKSTIIEYLTKVRPEVQE